VADDVAEARRAPGSDRMEREGGAFHRAVRAGYRDLADRFGWTVVDGAGTEADVATRVLAAVTPLRRP
jgi:thymidylate kinase